MKPNFNFRLPGYFYLMLCMILVSSCSTEEAIEESKENFKSKSFKTADIDLLNEFSKVYNENDCVDYCIAPDSGEYYIKRGYKSVNVGPNTKEMSYAAYNTEESFNVEVTYEITDGNSNTNATITIDIEGSIVVYDDVVSGTTVSHSIALEEEFEDCQQVQYYVRQNALGEPVEFTGSYNLVPVCTGPNVEIGELAPELGGYVFYILQEGDPGYDPKVTHGLVAAPHDQTGYRAGEQWSIDPELLIGTETGIGTGRSNTEAIIQSQGEGIYAASLCNNLVSGGFDDWYLPSLEEIKLLDKNLFLKGIGGITESSYWTSSESSHQTNLNAYSYSFWDKSSANARKYLKFLVRAIRSF